MHRKRLKLAPFGSVPFSFRDSSIVATPVACDYHAKKRLTFTEPTETVMPPACIQQDELNELSRIAGEIIAPEKELGGQPDLPVIK